MKTNTLNNIQLLGFAAAIIGTGLFVCGSFGFFLGSILAAMMARVSVNLTNSKLAVPVAYLSMGAIGAIGWGFCNWPGKFLVVTFIAMMFVSIIGKPTAPHTAK